MLRVGFEPTILMFDRVKTGHALDYTDTMIDGQQTKVDEILDTNKDVHIQNVHFAVLLDVQNI
jgi:hypothetical protein